MQDSSRLVRIRKTLGLSQEAMAHLLVVSLGTVNRWEKDRHMQGGTTGGGPAGLIYRAIEIALNRGLAPSQIIGSKEEGAGERIYRIFASAYGPVNHDEHATCE